MLTLLANTLFRQNAIDHLNAPIQEEAEFITITTPSWLLLLTCLFSLISIITWCIYGRINLKIETQGIILSIDQIYQAEINIQQHLKEQNNNVTELLDLYNKKLALFEKHFITRTDLLKAKNEYLTAKNSLRDNQLENGIATLLPTSTHRDISENPFTVLIFIPPNQGKKISPGALADIDRGSASGYITRISSSPISKQVAYFYLHNTSLVDDYFARGSPFLAKLSLSEAKNNIEPGAVVTAHIFYNACSPIQLLAKSHQCD